jgi:hypothetical protein
MRMEAIIITLMISTPIIVIGTALYFWRQRAASSALRRRRGLQILTSFLLTLRSADLDVE